MVITSVAKEFMRQGLLREWMSSARISMKGVCTLFSNPQSKLHENGEPAEFGSALGWSVGIQIFLLLEKKQLRLRETIGKPVQSQAGQDQTGRQKTLND